MKQLLVMIAVVVLAGCSKDTPETSPASDPAATAYEKLIADPIVEKAVHKSLKKPEGELTEADLAKVTGLALNGTKITDAGLKEVAKLQNLKELYLPATKVTKAGVAELKKALPNCKIYGP